MKYEALYGPDSTMHHYGAANHGKAAWGLLRHFRIESLVDIGCGEGHFCRQAVNAGVPDVAGVDFAARPEPAALVTWWRASAHDLPFPDDRFHWLTTFDVLEHLLPEEVEDVLREFRRVCRGGWMFSICYRPSKILVEGETLHPTVQPAKWWRALLEEYGQVEEYGGFLWSKFVLD